MRLDDSGVPLAMHVTGGDYWKNPVEEVFELKDGKAAWRNNSEKRRAKR